MCICLYLCLKREFVLLMKENKGKLFDIFWSTYVMCPKTSLKLSIKAHFSQVLYCTPTSKKLFERKKTWIGFEKKNTSKLKSNLTFAFIYLNQL